MKQDYDAYTSEDKKVWQLLFQRQNRLIFKTASDSFLDGIRKIGFNKENIPNFSRINKVLKTATGWKLSVVPGLIDNFTFFKLLKNKTFPATTWFRTLNQIDYLEEPDMFHDVYGHVPLLTNSPFCKFLQGLSHIALKHIKNEEVIERIARIYWYTVEFGLINVNKETKIYGAGILSSIGESQFCLSDKATHLQSAF